MLLPLAVQWGEEWELSKKQRIFGNRESFDRKVLSLILKGSTGHMVCERH